MAVVAPCSVAVPSPAHEPHIVGESGIAPEVDEVLDDRETGADGKAEHRRVDEEADPPPGQQHDDQSGLEDFLGHRRGVPGERPQIDADVAQQPLVQGLAISATAAPHASAIARLDGGSSLKLSISSRLQSRSSTGRSARQMFSMQVEHWSLAPSCLRAIVFVISPEHLNDTMNSRRGSDPSSNATAPPTDSVKSSVESAEIADVGLRADVAHFRRSAASSRSVTSPVTKIAGRSHVA